MFRSIVIFLSAVSSATKSVSERNKTRKHFLTRKSCIILLIAIACWCSWTFLISGLQRCLKIWLQGHSLLSSSTTERYALTPTRLRSFWRRLWHPLSKWWLTRQIDVLPTVEVQFSSLLKGCLWQSIFTYRGKYVGTCICTHWSSGNINLVSFIL